MSFVHDDVAAFNELVRIVAQARRLSPRLVEKDYWVAHALWSLHEVGLEVWFKGGTSLSKGFQLIQRFSEDLDLKLEPGTTPLAPVTNWKSDRKAASAAREAYFRGLATLLSVPGAEVQLDELTVRPEWRVAHYEVRYPSAHPGDPDDVLKPFVLLEVGNARVTPAIGRDMTSFIHDFLLEIDQMSEFVDNRPRGVRCVHPLVTLLEKLEAISKRMPGAGSPATFVRHYEDAARIIAALHTLPTLTAYANVDALARDMLAQRDLKNLPQASDFGFNPAEDARWRAIRAANQAIEPMFWGPRIPLEVACTMIRDWLEYSIRG